MRESLRTILLREGIQTPDGRRWTHAGHVMTAGRNGRQVRRERWAGTCPRCAGPMEVIKKVPRASLGFVFVSAICGPCKRPKRKTATHAQADVSDLV